MGALRNRTSPPPPEVRPQAPEKQHALKLLRERGYSAKRVIHVFPDCIAYEKHDGQRRTAWLEWLPHPDEPMRGRLVIIVRQGWFQAFRPEE